MTLAELVYTYAGPHRSPQSPLRGKVPGHTAPPWTVRVTAG